MLAGVMAGVSKAAVAEVTAWLADRLAGAADGKLVHVVVDGKELRGAQHDRRVKDGAPPMPLGVCSRGADRTLPAPTFPRHRAPHTDADWELLVAAARQKTAVGQLDLGLPDSPAGGMGVLLDALEHAYRASWFEVRSP